MKNLIKKTQNTAFQNNLWQRGSRIVLGVSGGPDSVCLLDIFANLAPKYDLKLIIAHVNYGLRGGDSERDEKFVRKLSGKHGILIAVLNAKTKKISENVLRDIRYDFFERVRNENSFDMIAVAHNLEDQVETFLMRIIRGAGLNGLSAMRYKSGKLIRPFLRTTRAEILEYLKKNKLAYRTDKTNESNLFFRNKVRNKLIPFLEKNFNPKIRKTIFAATVSIADDCSLLRDLAKKAARQNKTISVKSFLKLHPALQRRLLLQKIAEKKKELRDVKSSHIEEIIKTIKSTKGKAPIVLFKGLKVAKKGDRVTIDFGKVK